MKTLKYIFRDYVINNLPQLAKLDGQKIEKSERLKAAQQKEKAEKSVLDERNVSFTCPNLFFGRVWYFFAKHSFFSPQVW